MLTPTMASQFGASVVVESVNFRYSRAQNQVLRDVNLAIEPGESICLWGPSGSGKSTLLALIGGILSPTSGVVTVLADGVSHWEELEPAWVLQTANLLPSSTAYENVLMAVLISGAIYNDAVARANSALALVDMREFASQKAKRLSGGQAQRVAVARALATRSRLVLADEPSGQLDRQSTRRVCDALLGQTSGGATVIIASHDPFVAERCDRLVKFEDGRVIC